MDLSNIPDELQLMTGIDIPVEGFGFTMRQPSVAEISMLGEQNYFIALQLFTINKEALKITSDQATDWDIFQEAIKQKVPGINDVKVLISNFLRLFFKETVNLGPRSIMVMAKEEIVNIDAENFSDIQNIIGKIGGKSLLQPQEEQFNTKSKRAQEIAEKMKKSRARLEKVKAAEMGIKPKEVSKGFLSRFIKIVATKTSNSLQQVNSMTLPQLNSLVKSYNAWEAYDLDIRSRLAGAKSDKELIHWSMADQIDENRSIGTLEG